MDLDLRAYARVLSKRKWAAILTFLAFLGGGILITAASPRRYEAVTTLFVGERQIPREEARQGIFERNLTIGLLKSYVEIIESRSIAQRAIADAGLDVTPLKIERGIEAQALLETQIIEVTYTATDAALAQRIVNAVVEAFVGQIDRIGERQGGTPAVTIDVIDRAVATDIPVSPVPARNITLAALLGLLAAGLFVFLREHFDVTVKQREDVEALGLPVLGSIPRLETKRDEIYFGRDAQGAGGEAFRKLRTSIGFINLEHPTRTILVTSALPREGKTTMALNLAMAYAVSGLRTVLVEADLRRPWLHKVFGMVGTRGLTTAIIGEVPLDEAIVNTETRNLSVLLAGAIPPNPVELLASDQMTDVLERLGGSFDVVVVDSPPMIPVADPASLASRCDGVIVVARSQKTDRRRLLDASRTVDRAGGRLLGVVVNCVKPSDSPYDYGYSYATSSARRAPVAGGPRKAGRTGTGNAGD